MNDDIPPTEPAGTPLPVKDTDNKTAADASAYPPSPDPLATTVPHTRAGSAAAVGPPGYELMDEVGRGGMGVVFRARDHALDRDVAVKLLRPDCAATSETAARFFDEARITGQLQHPGVPAVYQVGRTPDGRPTWR